MSAYIKNPEQEKEFLKTFETIVKKHGVPEQMYIDTGKNIIIFSPSGFSVLSTPQNATCKQIEKIFNSPVNTQSWFLLRFPQCLLLLKIIYHNPRDYF